MGDDPRLGEVGHEHVEDVAQPGGGIAHAVRQVKPALGRLDRRWALAVLQLLDRVVGFVVDDRLRLDYRAGHIVAQAPADAAAAAHRDEAVLRTGVERVLAVDEFRMQHDVALLAGPGLQVGQALPGDEVAGAGDAALRYGRRQVVRLVQILALGTEQTVDPTVGVLRQAHVVDIGVGIFGLRQDDGLRPETKAVDAVFALGDGEEGFTVIAFDTDDNDKLLLPLHRSRIECGVDTQPLLHEGIGLRIKIVTPGQRYVVGGDDGMLPAMIDAVAGGDGRVRPRQ